MVVAEPKSITPPQPKDTRLLIGGEWTDAASGETFETINPATGETICNVAAGGSEDVDRAVRAARTALESKPWKRMSAADRGHLLYKLADAIEERAEELAALETLDNGKPIRDSLKVDLPATVQVYRYYAGWADKVCGRTIPTSGPFLAHTLHEPIGVCGQIIPWNFPLLMQAWKWAPALACGNTTILKPAEQTPLTAIRVAELALEVGFPPGVVNVITGMGPTAGAAIAAHPNIDKVAFTGSTAVGQKIMAAAAESNLKRVTLELGGKSPNIIFPDADVDLAAKFAYFGVFFNMGQCCTAGSRLFVHEDVYDRVMTYIIDRAKKQRIGDPFDNGTTHGPQVSEEQLSTILGFINAGRESGATCSVGGNRIDRPGYFVEPTVFENVEDDSPVARDEIFGPVLSVLRFKDTDEVIRRANASKYGLAAAVWSRDIGLANHVAAELKAGTVWINCYDVMDATVPFGGFKMSGIGRELGEYALSSYTEVKSVYTALSR